MKGRIVIYNEQNSILTPRKLELVAAYERLSDDDDKDGVSISIETQHNIIDEYCQAKGQKVYNHYVDDGYTGTNFNRPAFKQMMEDAKNGMFKTIIVKDLSRFGRNYLEVGAYLTQVFPQMGIRFVAIADDVDTAREGSEYDLLIPIRNIFNEFYPADCSKKVKQAKRAKAKNGEYVGSRPPYGYKKTANNGNKLEIDEVAAPVVKQIFEMTAYSGYGCNKISRILRENKVICPAAYQAQRSNRIYNKDPYDWNLVSVHKMLSNEVYLGHIVSGKRTKASFKSKRVVRQSEDKWIVVKNTHTPIISQQLWDDAHEALLSHKREGNSGFDNIFAGLLKCEECGQAISLSGVVGHRCYYTCNTYKKKGSDSCHSHYVRYDELYNAVLTDMQEVVSAANVNPEAFIQVVLKNLNDTGKISQLKAEKEISLLQNKIAEMDLRFEQMYSDKLKGLLSERRFAEMSVKCEAEQDNARARLEELEKSIGDSKDRELQVKRFVDIAKRICDVPELDRHVLNQLIAKIIVGERTKNTSDNTVRQRIQIVYKFKLPREANISA